MQKIRESISFEKFRSFFFIGLILVLSLAMLYIFRPFLYPIFWAAIISVMFHPLYEQLTIKLKHKSLASFLMLLFVLLILIIPLTVVVTLLVGQSYDLYTMISSRDLSLDIQAIFRWLADTPLQPFVEKARLEWPEHITTVGKQASLFTFNSLKSLTQNSIHFLFMFFLMLYTLFYFFKDGGRMLRRLMHLSPLGDKYEQMLFQRFTSVARATLKGTLIIGGIQGFIGGILFWITGIEGALIWGVIMTLLSIVPAVGSFIIWLPTGLIMLAMGNIWQGVTILVVGACVISLIDNLLRPPLIGKDVEMHPLLILFSTLGGILIFGISGFIIGPIMVALYLATMTIYDHHYQTELQHNK
jgi:predicted PurR-regulated permease PerM